MKRRACEMMISSDMQSETEPTPEEPANSSKKNICWPPEGPDARCLTLEEYESWQQLCRAFYHSQYQLEYTDFCKLWMVMQKDQAYVYYCPAGYKYCYLYPLQWGLLSLLIHGTDMMELEALTAHIANTSMAVTNLAMSGLGVQASALLRNLFEACMTLLVVIIDPKKRKLFVQGTLPENERTTWHKHFSFSAMEKCIRSYVDSRGGMSELLSRIGDWKELAYQELSATNHNNFWRLLLQLFETDDTGDPLLSFNLWGTSKANMKTVTEMLHRIMWYTTSMFYLLLDDETIDLSRESFTQDKTDKEFWIATQYIGLFSSCSYLLQVYVKEYPEILSKE